MLDIALERSLKDPKEEVCDSFTAAYEVTLRPHHGMLVRPIFAVNPSLFLSQKEAPLNFVLPFSIF